MLEKKESMICIHSHLLYDVDDGSESFLMSRMLLQCYREVGIYRICVTPHSYSMSVKNSPEKAQAAFQKLSEYIREWYPDMSIYPGCEVYCEGSMMDEVLEKLDSGIYPTLNFTCCFVLMELSPWTCREDATECVKALVDAGYIPVIAHLERYKELRDNLELVDLLMKMGALVQVNAYSLIEEETDPVCAWAKTLVLKNKVTFLGTDCHKTYYRPPNTEGLRWIWKMVEQGKLDKAYADAITIRNAEIMLLGRSAME